MAYRLLLDENIEHEVFHRLENYGHEAEHVDFVPTLGKGAADTSIGEYSNEEDRAIVTYDDDFVTEVDVDRADASDSTPASRPFTLPVFAPHRFRPRIPEE